jgi:hypothetical protein
MTAAQIEEAAEVMYLGLNGADLFIEYAKPKEKSEAHRKKQLLWYYRRLLSTKDI